MASRIRLQLSLDDPRPGITIEQLEEALEEREGDRRRREESAFPWPPELDRRRQDRRCQQARKPAGVPRGVQVAVAG